MSDDTDIEKGGGGFEPPKLSDSFYQSFPNEPTLFGTDPEDGMPRAAINTSLKLAEAPPYQRDKLVCCEDTSSFVIRSDWGTVLATFDPSEVERASDGRWRVKVQKSALRRLLEWIAGDTAPRWLAVEPIRPQCKWYIRKLQEFPHEPDHPTIYRMCGAQKDSEGEFISVGDQWMIGCDQRVPYHESARVNLTIFDERAEQLAREKEDDEKPVDFEAELARQLHDDHNP